MFSSDILRAFNAHPEKVEVFYMGTSTIGVLSFKTVELFENGIRQEIQEQLSVITEYFPTINKAKNPKIFIDGKERKIINHYPKNKFITVIVL